MNKSPDEFRRYVKSKCRYQCEQCFDLWFEIPQITGGKCFCGGMVRGIKFMEEVLDEVRIRISQPITDDEILDFHNRVIGL